MHKVVYNDCYGGFGLSYKAIDWLLKNGSQEIKDLIKDSDNSKFIVEEWFSDRRHNKDLVAVVEALGDGANGCCAKLKISEIDGKCYRIDEYDGFETVMTPSSEEWVTIED